LWPKGERDEGVRDGSACTERSSTGVLMAGMSVVEATIIPLALPTPTGAAPADTTNWAGSGGDGLWATAGNWDNGVPEASSVARIPAVRAPRETHARCGLP
jgi:hypothetical protein